MNPSKSQEYLVVEKTPPTYTILGETEIKQQINAFFQNEKILKHQRNLLKQEMFVKIGLTYVLVEIVQNDKLATSENLYKKCVEQHKPNDNCGNNFKTRDKLTNKRKISSLKSKYKSIALHAIL